MKSVGEITPDNLDQNIQKLREEFNKKSYYSENHPKTSHEYKRAMVNKKITRTNKALSANKIKWSNLNKLNDKEMLEFYRKHPGYLYYKEIMANMKIKQFNNPLKKRAYTGKDFIHKKIRMEHNNNWGHKKFGNTNFNYNHGNKYNNINNINRNDKFPKISKTNYFNNQGKQQKWKTNYVKNYNYNFNYNNYNYSHNHNYNYNINNININIKDKNNPYSLSWVNRILSQNDYRLEIKHKSNGIPKLITLNKKSEIMNKIYNNNKLYINNYIKDEKDKNEKKEENGNKENEKDNEDDLDEEQQMQFYKNQKNFFKARKDIKEEPEDLEEDKDEDKNKNNEKNENNANNKNDELRENKV